MKSCPNCGKVKAVSRVVRSALRKSGEYHCVCINCNTKFVLKYADVYPVKEESVDTALSTGASDVRVKIKPKTYTYRRYYGLCVVCGEPAYHSRELCKTCKEKGIQIER